MERQTIKVQDVQPGDVIVETIRGLTDREYRHTVKRTQPDGMRIRIYLEADGGWFHRFVDTTIEVER